VKRNEKRRGLKKIKVKKRRETQKQKYLDHTAGRTIQHLRKKENVTARNKGAIEIEKKKKEKN